MAEYTAKPYDLPVDIQLFKPSDVHDYVWQEIQRLHRDTLCYGQPPEVCAQIENEISYPYFPRYRDTRIDPELLVGNTWNDYHIFRKPHEVVVRDGNDGTIIGAAAAANNSSATRSKETDFWRWEANLKMWVPPQLRRLPAIGGCRYVHLREVIVDPAVEPLSSEIAPGTFEVGGLAVQTALKVLEPFRSQQTVAAYVRPNDPVDTSFRLLTEALGLHELENQSVDEAALVDPQRLVRVVARLKDVRKNGGKLLAGVTVNHP